MATEDIYENLSKYLDDLKKNTNGNGNANVNLSEYLADIQKNIKNIMEKNIKKDKNGKFIYSNDPNKSSKYKFKSASILDDDYGFIECVKCNEYYTYRDINKVSNFICDKCKNDTNKNGTNKNYKNKNYENKN